MQNNNIILFYKPEGYYGCLSNWYPCTFHYMDITFTSSEQYMMYQKAIMFHDYDIANKILKSNDLNIIKKLGRSVNNYDETRWSNGRLQIMRRGLRAKFSQNFELANILMSTKDSILAEAAPHDKIWGIGLAIDNPNAHNMNKWTGKNLLGKVLMQVRDDIKIMLEHSTNGIINPIESNDLPHHFLMNIKIKKLINYPELKDSLNCYLYSLPHVFQEKRNINHLMESTLAELENQIYNPWHGYEPIDGFKDLIQDINEMLLFGMLDKYLNQNNEIYFFAKYWLQVFKNAEINETILELELSNDMTRLHFIMDVGNEFKTKYPNVSFSTHSDDMFEIINNENDIELLSSTMFSMFRKITHWENTSLLSNDNKCWFIMVLERLMFLTQ